METYLSEKEWQKKEAAILALGAISEPEGALQAIKPHLSNLVPFLMEEFRNSNDIVRSTTCWTLSKFSDWICIQDISIFKQYLSELL